MQTAGGIRDRRLVILSNRLPVMLSRGDDGEWQLERSSGGLVTALEPLLRSTGGLWIGWPGTDANEFEESRHLLDAFEEEEEYGIVPVMLEPAEWSDFYLGFSNQVIWPLFHDLEGRCDFDPAFWDAYRRVNRKYARVLATAAREGDLLWVQDYQLMAVAEELHAFGLDHRVAFFLHVPFSDPDIFWKLPWRSELLRSLLFFDLIGFQTARDRANFIECIVRMDFGAEIDDDLRAVRLSTGRRVDLDVFPVSVDYTEFATGAHAPSVEARARHIRESSRGAEIMLGVDRLDYSKGLAEKLLGFRMALERYPELRGALTLVQLVVPSREDIPEYHEMREEVERLVGSIQGEFGRHDWMPILYSYGTWDREELLAHYRAADIALVTPLKDGMNLVAKEYCAAGPDEGVLILSEFAGAAAQLGSEALLVNPFDVQGVAATIRRATAMSIEERRARMKGLRDIVSATDIHWWLDAFLSRFGQKGEGPPGSSPVTRPEALLLHERRSAKRREFRRRSEDVALPEPRRAL